MARAEALLKVIGSRPDNLADNFATLMPNAPPALYQRILDLKVWLECNSHFLGKPSILDSDQYISHQAESTSGND